MSQSQLPTEPASWEVISQQPAQGQVSPGVYGPGHQVTIRLTSSGSTGVVFIGNADYQSPARIQAILQAKAEALHAVDNMSGQVF